MNQNKFSQQPVDTKPDEIYKLLKKLDERLVLIEKLLIYHIYGEGKRDDLFNQ